MLLNDTRESAISAFAGVDVAYIILPNIGDRVQRALFQTYLQAAKKSNVKHIVYLSSIAAEVAEMPRKVGCPFSSLSVVYIIRMKCVVRGFQRTRSSVIWIPNDEVMYVGEVRYQSRA